MFGEVLKKIRQKNGDSLRSLGEKIDNNFSYIDRIEKGKVPASKVTLKKLLEVYPFEKEELINAYCDDLLPEEAKRYIENDNNKDDFMNKIITLVKGLEKENKKMVLLGIIEKLEYISLKNGKYDLVKNILNEAKEKTEKL